MLFLMKNGEFIFYVFGRFDVLINKLVYFGKVMFMKD